MRKTLALALVCCLLTGCSARAAGQNRYEASFLGLFDTVTTIVGYADSEEEFRAQAQSICDRLLEYHQLFDIYQEYPGISNLKTVNDRAGGGPVKVDRAVMDLLLFCREMAGATGGAVDVTLGAALALWHDAREAGVDDPEHAALPAPADLAEAGEHRGFDKVLLNEVRCTVEITDPELRLDVGAVAKGWAVERVCAAAPAGLLVSVGGNIRATGPKPDGSAWTVGIQDPDGERGEYLCTLPVTDGSVVTSGDYQRYYTVDGVRYAHILNPDTLYPARRWRAVTVMCEDSGLADALSTALTVLPREEGEELLARFGTRALWVDPSGETLWSESWPAKMRNGRKGGTSLGISAPLSSPCPRREHHLQIDGGSAPSPAPGLAGRGGGLWPPGGGGDGSLRGGLSADRVLL